MAQPLPGPSFLRPEKNDWLRVVSDPEASYPLLLPSPHGEWGVGWGSASPCRNKAHALSPPMVSPLSPRLKDHARKLPVLILILTIGIRANPWPGTVLSN